MKRCTRARALLALVVATTACGRDHGGLALREQAKGGAAGSGNPGGSGGSGGRGRGGGGAGGSATGGLGGKFSEPVGRSVTTFFHGIADASRVVFCFARHDEVEPVLVGDPRPTGGLAYGASLSLETQSGIDFATEPVLPYAIAGDLELVAGLDCEQAVQKARDEMEAVDALGAGGIGGASGAGGESGGGGAAGAPEPPRPPRLRVAKLPEIPSGALASGYSSLYVAVGCLGGPAFTHALEEDACGRGYSPDSPTLSGMIVTLARAHADGMVALQALNASLASSALTVSSAPPDTSVQATVVIAYDVRLGSLSPRQPNTQFGLADYGLDLPGWKAQASSAGNPVVSEPWPDVLERAGLEFQAGRGYTLVAVGPRAELGTGFWNPPAIGVVDNDPPP